MSKQGAMHPFVTKAPAYPIGGSNGAGRVLCADLAALENTLTVIDAHRKGGRA